MARVHSAAALSARGDLVAIASSSADAAEAPPKLSASNGRCGTGRAARRIRHRRRARLHPQRHPRRHRPGRARRGQARHLREAAGDDVRGCRRAHGSCCRRGVDRGRAVRLPLPPDGRARPGPASRAARSGELLSVQGGYLQDWLAEPRRRRLAGRRLGSAARRGRSPTSARTSCDLVEFVTGDRIVRLNATTRTVYERARRHATSPPRTSRRSVVELSSGAVGTLLVSQVAPGARTRSLSSCSGRRRERPLRPGAARGALGRAALGSHGDAARPGTGCARCRAARIVPAGHPMGYQDAFNAFVADTYAAIGGAPPDGLPTFADGLRAVRAHRGRARLRGIRTPGWRWSHE